MVGKYESVNGGIRKSYLCAKLKNSGGIWLFLWHLHAKEITYVSNNWRI